MVRGLIAVVALAIIAGGVFLFLSAGETRDAEASMARSLAEVKANQKLSIPVTGQPVLTDLPVPSPTGPWPKIVVPETNYPFGRMVVGGRDSHSFTIRNEGEADLELKAGNPTCKCTTFELKSGLLKPGESTELVIEWKSGEGPDRAFRHGGDVHTNDPERKVVKFSVEGAIERPFEVMPPTWALGSLSREQTGTVNAVVMTRLYEKFNITSITSRSGLLKFRVEPLTPEQRSRELLQDGYGVHVELPADAPSGPLDDLVTILVDTQPEPVTVAVTARKFGLIRLQPMAGLRFDPDSMELNLGSFSSGTGREVKLLMIVDQTGMSEDFKFVETVADPAFIKAEIAPLGSPTGSVHRYTLTLRVPPGRPRIQRTDMNRGSLKLVTNHPSGEAIQLAILLNSN
jgi:hypothetical protein